MTGDVEVINAALPLSFKVRFDMHTRVCISNLTLKDRGGHLGYMSLT